MTINTTEGDKSGYVPHAGRMTRQDADRIIRRFLHREGIRTFEMVEDGDKDWAFWPTSQSHTTSYLHPDGSIEWYGQGR